MRTATRWILALAVTVAVASVVVIVKEVGDGQARTTPVRAVAVKHQSTRASAALIARVKPPMPYSRMTLQQKAHFQERALQTYRSRWHFWAHRGRHLEEAAFLHLQRCRGARAPAWACWALEASIWTRHELSETRGHIEAKRLLAMGANDWGTAVRYVQRVFPGTERWLLSCSHGEGGHGRWVRYGGGSYYPGYELTGAVGGNMQFRPGTFYGYLDDAVAWARAHGLALPALPSWDHSHVGADAVSSWLSPLAQAVTAAYMRAVVGNSRFHWAASIDAGCA